MLRSETKSVANRFPRWPIELLGFRGFSGDGRDLIERGEQGAQRIGRLRRGKQKALDLGTTLAPEAEKKTSVAIIRAVVGLSSSLGITTTAEGVETTEQLESLRREGCTEVQGFLFSAAKPADELRALLATFDQVSAVA